MFVAQVHQRAVRIVSGRGRWRMAVGLIAPPSALATQTSQHRSVRRLTSADLYHDSAVPSWPWRAR